MTSLPADILAHAERCQAFAEREIAPLGNLHDSERTLHAEIIAAIAASDLFWPAEEHQRTVRLALFHEEVGRFCIAVRSLVTVQSMVLALLARFGTVEQRSTWLGRLANGEVIGGFALSELEAGNDLGAIQTLAERDVSCWRVNGRKSWISMAEVAGLFVVFCRTREGPVALLVERNTPGMSVAPTPGELMAARGSMLGELTFEDAQVDLGNTLGPVGCGLSLVAPAGLSLGRVSVAAGAIGMMRRSLELSRAFSENRVQFGVPIVQHQAIASKLTAMVVDIEAARHLVLHAAELIDRRSRRAAVNACIAKHFAVRRCVRAASDAMQIHGARGFLRSAEVFRLYQDAKVGEVIEGSNEIQDLIIAESCYPATPANSLAESDVRR
jgi:alkylation response protein AidB-like acyl-CoA dehydrogenase